MDDEEEAEEEEEVAVAAKKVRTQLSDSTNEQNKKKNKKKKKKVVVVEEEGSDEEDETTTKTKQTPKKGGKGGNKPEEMDEVDKALAELDIKYVMRQDARAILIGQVRDIDCGSGESTCGRTIRVEGVHGFQASIACHNKLMVLICQEPTVH